MLFQRRKTEPEAAADAVTAIDRALRHAAAKDPHALREQTGIITRAIDALEAAAQGVDSVAALIAEARDLADSAAATGSEAKRALIAERYNDVIEAIDSACEGATAHGVNLIDDGDAEIEIDLQERGGVKLAVRHARLTRGIGGLKLSPAREAFADNAEIDHARQELDAALERIDGLSERFCADAAFLSERLTAFAA